MHVLVSLIQCIYTRAYKMYGLGCVCLKIQINKLYPYYFFTSGSGDIFHVSKHREAESFYPLWGDGKSPLLVDIVVASTLSLPQTRSS